MVRRLAPLALGLAAVFAALGRGQPPAHAPAAPTGVRVRVETTEDRVVEGFLTAPAVRIDMAYGPLDLMMEKVRRIDVMTEDGKTAVVVVLADGSQLRGEPMFAALAVTAPGGAVERFSPAALRQVTVVRPPETSVVAIVIGLVTLSLMEVVLGIDNVIFLAIVAGRLPKEQQPKARRIGLAAALGTRILLLFSLSFLLGLTKPILRLPFPGLDPEVREISWRDIILLAGGVFLIGKSVWEMHHKLEEAKGKREKPGADAPPPKKPATFAWTIVEIAVIDLLFSLDSVITAVGMVDTLWVMIAAMVVAMLVMLGFAGPISDFVDRHPTVKMLALAFLILIGVLLVAEGLGQHVGKGYIYFAMGFAVVMELVNLRLRGSSENTEKTERG